MRQLQAVGCVCLFGFITFCDPLAAAAGAGTNNGCDRETCEGLEYNTGDGVCCQNHFYPGPGLSCCGDKPFNPQMDTCCKAGHGHSATVQITQGLSVKGSMCCGLSAYNPVNQICCQDTIFDKPAAMAECCGKNAIDGHKQLCCGPEDNKTIQVKMSDDHQCCGHTQFNTKTECCCLDDTGTEIRSNHLHCSINDSAGIYRACIKRCCQQTTVTIPLPKATLCANEVYNEEMELCCGPDDHKRKLTRESTDHECCSRHGQYNTNTQCCCWKNDTYAEAVQRLNYAITCAEECAASEGIQQQLKKEPEPKPKCVEPNTGLCGRYCYDPRERRCCETTSSPQCSASGQCDAVSTVYNPHTHICCDGRLSKRKPWMDQCCGDTPYGSAQRGFLCCNNTLYKDREDGEVCSETNIPYNPAKGTVCCSKFHVSPGEHCCGADIYRPHTEICCDGHRHPKGKNLHCCGGTAYNIKDPQMKCCAGTLYNLTSFGKPGGDMQCCGSILHIKQNQVCCSSEDEKLLYSIKAGFQCCSQRYYNPALWWCCAGELRPVRPSGQHQHTRSIKELRLLSVDNLNEKDLCEEIHIGIVESVSPHSVVFRSVLKVHGRNATSTPLPHRYILKTPDRCSFPKLTTGQICFFNEVAVFTDLNHGSVLDSLYFIISKCFF